MRQRACILIANRGEIALRAANACRNLGIQSVAVFSKADRDSLHVTAADNAFCIGPAPSRNSYLDQNILLHVARHNGCTHLYPGYGFLAENAEFAARCEAEGIKFIGPSSACIETMGDKASARATAMALGVAVVPGTDKTFTNSTQAKRAVQSIGFPLLLKATAGGGGKGMRVVANPSDFETEFEQASAEALDAFSNPAIYIERYFAKVRHIEVQIIVDQHGNVYQLGERDCTLQRRHQKLLEESPSPAISRQERDALLDDALKLVNGIDYEGAGTVEFIFDETTRQHYFIEMNTRIQVEHPVTEMRCAMDLVTTQIRVAMGEQLNISDSSISENLHTMEFRINAEDPENNFMPCPGVINKWRPPTGEGLRVDTFVREGMTIVPHYDSMVAKLLVAGRDRDEVIDRARSALLRFEIAGIKTTRSFHLKVLDNPMFCSSSIHTRWVEQNLYGHTKN